MLERKLLVDELDGKDLRITRYSTFLDASIVSESIE